MYLRFYCKNELAKPVEMFQDKNDQLGILLKTLTEMNV